eukprot:m.236942 g.236942  ORF g.236942 m.236942 type:complete len:1068 (+) comp33695_c0_seq2:122-3325(+)
MQIYAKDTQDQLTTIIIDIDPSETIAAVKKQLQTKLNTTANCRLLFGGKDLISDSRTLSEYQVNPESTLEFTIMDGFGFGGNEPTEPVWDPNEVVGLKWVKKNGSGHGNGVFSETDDSLYTGGGWRAAIFSEPFGSKYHVGTPVKVSVTIGGDDEMFLGIGALPTGFDEKHFWKDNPSFMARWVEGGLMGGYYCMKSKPGEENFETRATYSCTMISQGAKSNMRVGGGDSIPLGEIQMIWCPFTSVGATHATMGMNLNHPSTINITIERDSVDFGLTLVGPSPISTAIPPPVYVAGKPYFQAGYMTHHNDGALIGQIKPFQTAHTAFVNAGLRVDQYAANINTQSVETVSINGSTWDRGFIVTSINGIAFTQDTATEVWEQWGKEFENASSLAIKGYLLENKSGVFAMFDAKNQLLGCNIFNMDATPVENNFRSKDSRSKNSFWQKTDCLRVVAGTAGKESSVKLGVAQRFQPDTKEEDQQLLAIALEALFNSWDGKSKIPLMFRQNNAEDMFSDDRFRVLPIGHTLRDNCRLSFENVVVNKVAEQFSSADKTLRLAAAATYFALTPSVQQALITSKSIRKCFGDKKGIEQLCGYLKTLVSSTVVLDAVKALFPLLPKTAGSHVLSLLYASPDDFSDGGLQFILDFVDVSDAELKQISEKFVPSKLTVGNFVPLGSRWILPRLKEYCRNSPPKQDPFRPKLWKLIRRFVELQVEMSKKLKDTTIANLMENSEAKYRYAFREALKLIYVEPSCKVYLRKVNRLADSVKQKHPQAPRQQTSNLAILCQLATQAQAKFVEFFTKFATVTGGNFIQAETKSEVRIIEKVLFNPNKSKISGAMDTQGGGVEEFDFSTMCDVVRGGIVYTDMNKFVYALQLLTACDPSEADHTELTMGLLGFDDDTDNFAINIVRVKDRFGNPGSGYYADMMCNFTFVVDGKEFVHEIQMMHTNLHTVRVNGAHKDYNVFRTAMEFAECRQLEGVFPKVIKIPSPVGKGALALQSSVSLSQGAGNADTAERIANLEETVMLLVQQHQQLREEFDEYKEATSSVDRGSGRSKIKRMFSGTSKTK